MLHPTTEAPMTEGTKMRRRAEAYAAKFMAETSAAEPPRVVSPTDSALTEILAPCARVPLAEWYPLIRAAIQGHERHSPGQLDLFDDRAAVLVRLEERP